MSNLIMPMQLLFLQDRYLFLPGLIEKHSDYAKVCFKWKEEDGKLFSSRNTIADSIAEK